MLSLLVREPSSESEAGNDEEEGSEMDGGDHFWMEGRWFGDGRDGEEEEALGLVFVGEDGNRGKT